MSERRERLSYFKFFVADWKELRDRGVTIAARGVRIEVLPEMLNADDLSNGHSYHCYADKRNSNFTPLEMSSIKNTLPEAILLQENRR